MVTSIPVTLTSTIIQCTIINQYVYQSVYLLVHASFEGIGALLEILNGLNTAKITLLEILYLELNNIYVVIHRLTQKHILQYKLTLPPTLF